MRSICLGLFAAILLVGCQEKKDGVAPGPTPGMPSSPGTPPAPPKAEPSAEVSGMIKGKAFKPEKTSLQGGKLSFRSGKDIYSDMEIAFQLPGNADEIREGKVWKLGGEEFGYPFLFFTANSGKDFGKDFSNGMVGGEDYSMTLTITKRTAKSLEGTIDLKIKKPENTQLAGKFTAVVKKSGTDPLDADDVPYVQGKIIMKGEWKQESLSAGFRGKGTDGKSVQNMIGSSYTPTSGSGSNLSFEPQLTSLFNDKQNGLRFVHTKMMPGEYLVYVRRGGVFAAWKNITVKAGDQQTVDLTIDLANVGSLVVTLPDEEVVVKDNTITKILELIPEGIVVPTEFNPFLFDVGNAKKGEKTIAVKNVPAGKYKATFGNSEALVEVVAGKEAAVTLVTKKK